MSHYADSVSCNRLTSEVAAKAQFTPIRYSQCWEDADVLMAGLNVSANDSVLSIASAGDNTLSLLAAGPKRVIALDLSAAQLACLALRVAAFTELSHAEVLQFLGCRPSNERIALYHRCKRHMSAQAQRYWDSHLNIIAKGVISAGRFEHYFRLFRQFALPLTHSNRTVKGLLTPRSPENREKFFSRIWNTPQWRAIFSVFFSRFTMGLLGREGTFFDYVDRNVAEFLLESTEYALTKLDPADNCYLRWILTGEYGDVLPFYLRAENFDSIRDNLDKLEWHQAPVETYIDSCAPASITRFNLSDIFEYMSPEAYVRLLARLARASAPGGRLLYWNMLAPRSRPGFMADAIKPQTKLAQLLYLKNKAFFYSKLVIEEVR